MGLGATIAWYNYGRERFTRKGWKNTARLDVDTDLTGRVFVVTGANSGIGKCLTDHLYARGAGVHMVCRSEDRAEAARTEIIEAHGERDESGLRVVIADVSVRDEVLRAADELRSRGGAIDGLVCNAGSLLRERTTTVDGVETTFACHFLYGVYLLGQTLMPMLSESSDPRLVLVTSGGMYTTELPGFGDLVDPESYDGTLAYAYAKRAQVYLAERWAAEHPGIKVVTAHPGWTSTPGVEKAFGGFSRWLLKPLRTPWEGTEGIAWLCSTPGHDIRSGGLYLDGHVEPKHLHRSTEIPAEAVDVFMAETEAFLDGRQ